MKCMPITRSARPVTAASLVIEIELVLVARIASSGRIRSRSARTFCLTSRRSTTASTTSGRSSRESRAVEVVIRPSAASRSAAEIFSFSTSLPKPFSILASPRSRASCATSTRMTSKPLPAATWVMP